MCDDCINSMVIIDNNGYDTCTGCGKMVSTDRIDDIGIDYDIQPKYSIYDEGINYDFVCDMGSSTTTTNAKYLQKCKEYSNTIQNYSKNTDNQFPMDIAKFLYETLCKQTSLEDLFTEFKRNPTKKNTFQICRFVKLSDELGNKYKSRINGNPLNILKRKNIITRWFQLKYYILKEEKLLPEYGLDRLLPDDIVDLLRKCFSCFITEYFIIIGRKIRIASPNSIVFTLCYLYIFNPHILLQYYHLFDIPKQKTIYYNIDILVNVWKYKFRTFNILRNYVKSIITENFKDNQYIKENILNIDYENEKKSSAKCVISSDKKNVQLNKLKAIFISLNHLTW